MCLLGVLAAVLVSCAPAEAPAPQVVEQTKIVKETEVVEVEVEKVVEVEKMGEPIVIGTAQPMTGPETYLYTVECHCQKMAAAEINAKGGVLGRPLEVRCMDDAGDPKQGVVVAQSFCDDPEIVAVYGHGYSGVTIPALPIYNECRMPVVSHGSNPRITAGGFDNVFQNLIDDSLNGKAAADFLFDEKGVKSVAIVHNKTMWGEGVAVEFQKACEELGIEITSFQGVDADSPDYSAVLTKIKGENPDAIYTGMYVESARLRKQMLALGMGDVVYMGAELTNTEYMNSVGEDGVGAYTVTSAPSVHMSEQTEAFAERALKSFGLLPEPWAFYGYEGIYIIADAIERAGTTEREAIMAALRDTDLQGVGMEYHFTFDEQGRVEEPRTFVYECTAPATFEPVWTWIGAYPD